MGNVWTKLRAIADSAVLGTFKNNFNLTDNETFLIKAQMNEFCIY